LFDSSLGVVSIEARIARENAKKMKYGPGFEAAKALMRAQASPKPSTFSSQIASLLFGSPENISKLGIFMEYARPLI